MQGAPPGGLPRVAGELEPRDDHDRSRVRGPNLRRAAHPRVRRAGDRARAARRGPADARRPDGAERRGGDRRDRRPRTPGRRFDRRGPRCHPSRRRPERLQGDDGSGRARDPSRRDRPLARPRVGARRRDRVPADRPALVHARRRGKRFRSRSDRARAPRRPQPRDEPGDRDPRGGVGRRVERVRARGHARRRGQRRRDLLDRERRSDGRAYRRFDHRRARDDALRPGVPTDARRGARLHPGDRRGDRRVEHPVRGRASHRPPGLDRDEPARLTFVGPGVEGDRFPDRQGRRAPRGRLHARRDPERHHGRHARGVRADARLRRGQGAPVRVREVPRGRPGPVLDDEVRRRGHGDRSHLQGGARQGLAFARTPRRRPRGCGRRRLPRGARRAERAPAASGRVGAARRAVGGRGRGGERDRSVVRRSDRAGGRGGRCAGRPRARRRGSRGPGARQAVRPVRPPSRGPGLVRRSRGSRAPDGARRPPGLQDGRHLRGRVPGPHPLPLLHVRGAGRGAPGRAAARGDPRSRSQPDRAGDRVRLRLRPCGVRAGGRRVRARDDQLQPGDRVDGLRHERPPVLRTGVDGGRVGGVRDGAARRRDLPVRRPDAAPDGARHRSGGLPGPGDARRSRSTSPRTVASSPSCSTRPASPRPSTARPTTSTRRA